MKLLQEWEELSKTVFYLLTNKHSLEREAGGSRRYSWAQVLRGTGKKECLLVGSEHFPIFQTTFLSARVNASKWLTKRKSTTRNVVFKTILMKTILNTFKQLLLCFIHNLLSSGRPVVWCRFPAQVFPCLEWLSFPACPWLPLLTCLSGYREADPGTTRGEGRGPSMAIHYTILHTLEYMKISTIKLFKSHSLIG